MSAPVPLIKSIESRFLRPEPLPEFRPGDRVKVWVKITEGQKTRLQAFEGVCIRRTRGGNRATFTVRKISYGVGVERVFADNSPNVDRVEVLTRGKVHQAKLYYLRGLSGKAARIKERTFDKSKAEKKSRPRRKQRKAAKLAAAQKAAAQTGTETAETTTEAAQG
jgi:large subunit ribosomal protein L19